jgi:hypothetical protein
MISYVITYINTWGYLFNIYAYTMTTDADLHRCLQEISEIETILSDAREILRKKKYTELNVNQTEVIYQNLLETQKKHKINDEICKTIKDIKCQNHTHKNSYHLFANKQELVKRVHIYANYRSIEKLVPLLESQLSTLYVQIL